MSGDPGDEREPRAELRRCVLYFRERSSEPGANAAALTQQNRLRDRFVATGATILASFTEDESTLPAAMNSRPALLAAYHAALHASASHDPVELVVMRVDPIGSGARFPMQGTEVDWLQATPALVSINHQGCEGIERQLRHEWRYATGGEEIEHPRL